MTPPLQIALLSSDDDAGPLPALLRSAGFGCARFASGQDLLGGAADGRFDLLLIGTPPADMPTLDVIRALRADGARPVPLILLSALLTEDEEVEALDAGADDYLPAHCSPRVLLARVAALQRRREAAFCLSDGAVRAGPYVLDPAGRFALLRGHVLTLTPREYDLTRLLFAHAGRVLATPCIEQAVWGRALPQGSRALAGLISRIRRSLGLRPENGVSISVVYGLGYRLDVHDDNGPAMPPGAAGKPGERVSGALG
jgi:DNA-binding response OmpR family regulator